MMTVIYANWGDEDTKRLTALWKGLDANVIEINRSFPTTKDEVLNIYEQIDNEEDTLLFCGHGSSNGLWSPNFNGVLKGNILDSQDIPYIKAKNIIGIWCHAREFSKINNLRGFYSSMFISNIGEAHGCGIFDVNSESIYNSITIFCNKVNSLLKEKKPLEQWLNEIQSELLTDKSTSVEKFNYDNLYYSN